MDPLRLDGVEPGGFGRQPTGYDPHALPGPLDGVVMGLHPGPDRLADGPRGIIPDHHQGSHPLGSHTVTTPGQKGWGDGTDRASLPKPQQSRLALVRRVPYQQPLTGHSLRVGVALGARQGVQLGDRVRCRPAMRSGRRQSAPPDFIGPAQGPAGELLDAPDQAIVPVFFRTSAGSGLVSQCLARCQRTPSCVRAGRMVSPLTWREVNPWAKLTSAASARGQRLVGLPKVRGR
jgi:hypothetical protein